MKRSASIITAFTLLALVGLWRVPDQARETQPGRRRPAAESCTWLAGDLHARTAGPGVETGATAPLSLSELADAAQARGLDYLAVADRERLPDIEDPAFGGSGLEWLIGFEKVAAQGTLVLAGRSLSFSESGRSPRSLIRLANDVHSTGGLVQIGRPEAGDWSNQLLTRLDPDGVEVWRGGPFGYRTPGLEKESDRALRFYDSLLDHGFRVSATGASDTSSRVLSEIAGVGQPTTWACVDDDTPTGLIDAIKEGRTTISHDSPVTSPPLLFIEGDQDTDGEFEERLGESLPAGSMLRVTVRDAPAAKLRLISSGSRLLKELTVDAFDFTTTMEAPEGVTWVRAELYLDETLVQNRRRSCPDPRDLSRGKGKPVSYCNGRIPMLAVSSPIYIE